MKLWMKGNYLYQVIKIVSPPAMCEFPFIYVFTNTCYHQASYSWASLTDIACPLAVVWTWFPWWLRRLISCSCLITILFSPSVKCLFVYFAYFSIVFFLLIYRYIYFKIVLWELHVLQYFFPVYDFSLLMIAVDEWKF